MEGLGIRRHHFDGQQRGVVSRQLAKLNANVSNWRYLLVLMSDRVHHSEQELSAEDAATHLLLTTISERP